MHGVNALRASCYSVLLYLTAFIVEFEHPSYTVQEGESIEVCLVNTTNPERIHNFIVQFYTSYDCDISSPVVPVEATGNHYIFRIMLKIFFLINFI